MVFSFTFILFFFFMTRLPPRSTLFPTRRSSDLGFRVSAWTTPPLSREYLHRNAVVYEPTLDPDTGVAMQDRKSTRLNSSHRCISYAVFCLKKKKKKKHKTKRQALRRERKNDNVV